MPRRLMICVEIQVLAAERQIMRNIAGEGRCCSSRGRKINAQPLPLLIAVCKRRSEEHTSELQSLMRISYAVFCLKKKTTQKPKPHLHSIQDVTHYNNTI